MPIYAAKLHSKVACAKLLTLVVSSRNLIIDLCEYDITSLFRTKFRSLPLSGKFLKHKKDPSPFHPSLSPIRILLISFPPPSSILASRNRGQSECRPRSPSHRPNNFGSGREWTADRMQAASTVLPQHRRGRYATSLPNDRERGCHVSLLDGFTR